MSGLGICRKAVQREGFVFRAGSHGDAVGDGAAEDLCEAIVVVRFEGEIGSIQSANQQTCTFEVPPHPFAQGKHTEKGTRRTRAGNSLSEKVVCLWNQTF